MEERKRQRIYPDNFREFLTISRLMEQSGAVWVGYDEVAYRRQEALIEQWQKDGVLIEIVLPIPRPKKKRPLVSV